MKVHPLEKKIKDILDNLDKVKMTNSLKSNVIFKEIDSFYTKLDELAYYNHNKSTFRNKQ